MARSGSTPSVRITQLAQVFERDRPPVLDRIDLEVAPGEFVCLLGASGSGKSTLLSLIAGLGAPTSGNVEVTVGRPALMFQEPALRVHELSGGMQQRVALARARDALHEELIRLWSEQGLSIVFVTHFVREAVRLGQRVLL